MTLLEAVNTGKPFKRKCFDQWLTVKDKRLFSVESAIATDWEVKTEPKVMWLNIYEDAAYAYASEYEARRCCNPHGVTKKFKEVIE